ncbi:PRD domain-containing protein [Haloimpatiens sp. FM7315]|uniref:PRD domain-containing protein n=1 Tax=Haloimpatiens sp. FM7315 TaxID=3298609 RepID=UPI0035A30904
MGNYIIKKILNNNAVIATKDDVEVILTGKAIGFDLKKDSIIPNYRINSVFVKASSTNEDYTSILNSIDKNILGISEEIIYMCEEKLKVKLNKAIHISLPDHISFAITRLKQNIKIENPFLKDLAILYPKEYELASKAVSLVNNRLGIRFPDGEIGFICLHINAAIHSQNVNESISYTKKINETITLISKLLKRDFDKNSMEYVRTVTHLKFMLERTLSGKPIKNPLLNSIKKEFYHEFDTGIKIALKIESLFNVRVSEDEIGYIALHLKRLCEI